MRGQRGEAEAVRGATRGIGVGVGVGGGRQGRRPVDVGLGVGGSAGLALALWLDAGGATRARARASALRASLRTQEGSRGQRTGGRTQTNTRETRRGGTKVRHSTAPSTVYYCSTLCWRIWFLSRRPLAAFQDPASGAAPFQAEISLICPIRPTCPFYSSLLASALAARRYSEQLILISRVSLSSCGSTQYMDRHGHLHHRPALCR